MNKEIQKDKSICSRKEVRWEPLLKKPAKEIVEVFAYELKKQTICSEA